MPPKNPLADDQVELVKAWIANGAKKTDCGGVSCRQDRLTAPQSRKKSGRSTRNSSISRSCRRRWSIRDDIPWGKCNPATNPAIADVVESFCAVEIVPAGLRGQVSPARPRLPRAGVVRRELGLRGVEALARDGRSGWSAPARTRGANRNRAGLGRHRRVGPADRRRPRAGLLHDVPGTRHVAALPQPAAGRRRDRPPH